MPVDHLPSRLCTISFGYSFNHTVDLLPPKLEELNLGVNFHKHLLHLPSSITTLTLCLSGLPAYHRVDFPSSLQDIIYILPNTVVDVTPGVTYEEFVEQLSEEQEKYFAWCCLTKLWEHKTEFVWFDATVFYEKLIGV